VLVNELIELCPLILSLRDIFSPLGRWDSKQIEPISNKFIFHSITIKKDPFSLLREKVPEGRMRERFNCEETSGLLGSF
jgi:hypothetical protein